MQALHTVAVTRPWHWGIAILSDPSLGGEIPEVDPKARVSANANGVVVLVRHAQDVESLEGDFDWAEATVTIRHWSAAPEIEADRTVVFEGVLATPTGRLWLGDADEEVVMTGLSTETALRVLSPSDDLASPDHVWVDVWES
ncbi:MAG TPA: hypothetical protein VM575_17920 [Nocardioides sp.]|nr:hypothetical protein [Nocardioides sp.]